MMKKSYPIVIVEPPAPATSASSSTADATGSVSVLDPARPRLQCVHDPPLPAGNARYDLADRGGGDLNAVAPALGEVGRAADPSWDPIAFESWGHDVGKRAARKEFLTPYSLTKG